MVRCTGAVAAGIAAFLIVLTAGPAAAGTGELRLAAIIDRGDRAMALIEDSAGEQHWLRIGESLAGGRLTGIEAGRVTLETADGALILTLAGTPVRGEADAGEAPAASAYQSRTVPFRGLLSRLNDVDPRPDESYDEAVARTMNEVLGFTAAARITAIDRVAIESPAQAHAELQQRLAREENPVRITLENDPLKSVYVVPE
ncbi:MAG: hypothetical protein R3315_12770 [Woeseiaceae bacterium]|nr:hypothetical protein [Woeseiaceae bacterium]